MLLRGFFLAVLALVAACATPAVARDAGMEELERSLRLNPIQQRQFHIALQATQRAMLTIGMGVMQFKTRLGMELLKDRPDPKALADVQDEIIELTRPQVRAARDEWLRFYSLLDDEQLGVARGYMEERLRKLEEVAEQVIRGITASMAKKRAEPLQQ